MARNYDPEAAVLATPSINLLDYDPFTVMEEEFAFLTSPPPLEIQPARGGTTNCSEQIECTPEKAKKSRIFVDVARIEGELAQLAGVMKVEEPPLYSPPAPAPPPPPSKSQVGHYFWQKHRDRARRYFRL
jgi:hypothetical protein